MDKFKNYKYYKGENDCPFNDEGENFWWKVEFYAYNSHDEKILNQLSETMCAFIRERHWQGDTCDADTKWSVALSRATEMYVKGVWVSSYLTGKKAIII